MPSRKPGSQGLSITSRLRSIVGLRSLLFYSECARSIVGALNGNKMSSRLILRTSVSTFGGSQMKRQVFVLLFSLMLLIGLPCEQIDAQPQDALDRTLELLKTRLERYLTYE